MFFLNAKDPRVINATRTAMVDIGYKAQRFAANLFSLPARRQTQQPPATIGKAPIKEHVVHFVNKKMPGGLPTQAMLWHAGVQTVLPPGYLCCGYPQRGNGMYDKADKIITDNRVLFHRVANTLNYLDIKIVVVSCGTCYDQLAGYEFEKIFPDVSTQVRFRKQEELQKNAGQVRSGGYDGTVKVLTSCPSCLQGLSRYEGDTGMEADYIAVEVARHVLGQAWMETYVKAANGGGIERALV